MSSMFLPFKRFADFQGRSGRKEYWMFYLMLCLVTCVGYLGLLAGASMESNAVTFLFTAVLTVFMLAVLVPQISVTIRRLHDIDKSGWFLLVALIPFVGGLILLALTLMPGTAGPNRFGAAPAAL